jgi:hypothetical protein
MWPTSERPPIGAPAVTNMQWTLALRSYECGQHQSGLLRGALFMANMIVGLFRGGTV